MYGVNQPTIVRDNGAQISCRKEIFLRILGTSSEYGGHGQTSIRLFIKIVIGLAQSYLIILLSTKRILMYGIYHCIKPSTLQTSELDVVGYLIVLLLLLQEHRPFRARFGLG